MKKKNRKFLKHLIMLIIASLLVLALAATASAEEIIIEAGGEIVDISSEVLKESGEIDQNIFETIYSVVESNADKIFSILAFLGTLIVSIGYKSGLLPLLNDALSKLKGAIENVRENGERNNAKTSDKIDRIAESVSEMTGELALIEAKVKDYELLSQERETVKLLLEEQINMLYAIFMSSALPQYQKDEIGQRIKNMREELSSYEKAAK